MSHSKRNTSRPVFTSHERALAQSNWTSSSARLNRDSFLPFGSCSLCLEIAREPVACQRGDIFCRECALANILAQKKELKRAAKVKQNAEKELAEKAAREHDEENSKAIEHFEMTQAGLAPTNKSKPVEEAPRGPSQPIGNELVLKDKSGGTKRKLEDGVNSGDSPADEDRAKARKAIEDEKASKTSVPFFWTPSNTPDVRDTKLGLAKQKTKEAPMCPASSEDAPHAISMQKLITLHFDEDAASSASTDNKRMCPSCRKALTNATEPILAKRCGHVLCNKCVKQFLIPSGKQQKSEHDDIVACYVCEEPVAVTSSESGSQNSLPTGLVALKSEGTGFSARGANKVAKSGTAFQC